MFGGQRHHPVMAQNGTQPEEEAVGFTQPWTHVLGHRVESSWEGPSLCWDRHLCCQACKQCKCLRKGHQRQ